MRGEQQMTMAFVLVCCGSVTETSSTVSVDDPSTTTTKSIENATKARIR